MKVKRIEITKFCLACALAVVSHGVLATPTSVQELDSSLVHDNSVMWSGDLTSTYSSSMQKTDAFNYGAGLDLDGTVAVTIDKTKYSFNTSATKATTGERKLEMNNGFLAATRLLHKFSDELYVKGSAQLTLPFSENARDYQHLYTGLSLSPKLTWRTTPHFTLAYGLTGQVNFHHYKVSYSGSSNYQYVAANALAATYEFNSGIYLYGSATYSRYFTYQGNTKDAYKFLQLVGYSLGQYDLSVGHMIGGSPLAANGEETEINFYDSNNSVVFGMVTVSF